MARWPISVGNQGGRRCAEKKAAQKKVCLLLKDGADLEHTTYVRRVKPNDGSGQKRCAANIRSVLVFKAFVSNIEEPFGVHGHEWNISGQDFPLVFIPRRQRSEKAEKDGETIT